MSFKPKHSIKNVNFAADQSTEKSQTIDTNTLQNPLDQSFKGLISPPIWSLSKSPSNSTQITSNLKESKSRYQDASKMDQSFKNNLKTIKRNFDGVFNHSGLHLSTQKKGENAYFKSYGSDVSKLLNQGSNIHISQTNNQGGYNNFINRSSSVSVQNQNLETHLKIKPHQGNIQPKSVFGIQRHSVVPQSESKFETLEARIEKQIKNSKNPQKQRNLPNKSTALPSISNQFGQKDERAELASGDSMRQQNSVLKAGLDKMERQVKENLKHSQARRDKLNSEGSSTQMSPQSRVRSKHSRLDVGSNKNLQFTQDRGVEGRSQNYSQTDIQSQLLNSQIASRGNQIHSKNKNFRDVSSKRNKDLNLAIITDESVSSMDPLPIVPHSNKNKNDILLQIYEKQLLKQKKQRILGIEEDALFAETEKIILRKRAQQFIESQNNRIKNKIKMKSMTAVERMKIIEQKSQVKMEAKKMEKQDIDTHWDQMDRILLDAQQKEKEKKAQKDGGGSSMKEAKTEQEYDSDGKPKENNADLNVSQDSASKNVGVLGQYISRVIVDKEHNPEKYENEVQDIDELLRKQLEDQSDDFLNEYVEGLTDGKNTKMSKSGQYSTKMKMGLTKQSKFSIITSARQTGTSFAKDSSDVGSKVKFRSSQQKQIHGKLLKHLTLKLQNNSINEEGTFEGRTVESPLFQNNSPAFDHESPLSRKKKAPAKIAHEILTVKSIQEMKMDNTTSTFNQAFPDFKTGMTPHRVMHESDLDPDEITAQRDILDKQNKKSQLYKKKDFDEINTRQKKFKDLMQTKQSEKFDKSEIVQQESNHSDEQMANFPFAGTGHGQYYKAYEQPRKITEQKSLKNFNVGRTEQEDKVLKEQIEKQMDVSVESVLDEELENPMQKFAHMVSIQENGNEIKENEKHLLMLKFIDYVTKDNFQENIIQLQNQLGEDFLKKGFEGHEKFNDPQIALFAKFISERKQFYDMCKSATSPKAQEAAINDPDLLFFKSCEQQKIPALSILQKRYKKALNLKGYYLKEAECAALQQALTQFPDYIDTIVLQDNGIKDKGMHMILEGLNEMKLIKRFVCINNHIWYDSHCSLRKILDRPAPNHLVELRLTNCQLNMTWTQNLLEVIIEKGTLRKLGLVKVNLHSQSVDSITSAIEGKNSLVEIDISWNNLLPSDMFSIAESLGKNRNLQSVNLSWNSFRFFDGKRKAELMQEPMDKVKDENGDNEIIQNICKFIKYNPKLLHFDISKTGLSKYQLIELGPALRRAKSLISLHASGNPGVNQELQDELFARVHCQPKYPINVIDDVTKDNIEINKNGFLLQNQLQEGLKLKEFKAQKCEFEMGHITRNTELDISKLIFTRVLGHKYDMPSSGQFKMLTQPNEKCWVCEGLVHTLIFWSRRIGWACDYEIESIVEEKMIQSLDELHERIKTQIESNKYNENVTHNMAYNVELGTPGNSPDAPVIYGQFTNWHPMKMTKIEDYCDAIDKNQPDWIGRLMASDKCRANVQTIDDLNEQELENYEELKRVYRKSYRKNWNSLIDQNLLYKKTNMIYNHYLLKKPDDYGDVHPVDYDAQDPLFVFPCFIKPGKQYFMVRSDPRGDQKVTELTEVEKSEGDENIKIDIQDAKIPAENDDQDFEMNNSLQISQFEPEYFSHAIISPYRTEDIPIAEKTYSTLSSEVTFKKNQSVFKDWKEDTDTKLKGCCDHDFELWKCNENDQYGKNFDNADREKLLTMIRDKYIEPLKIIHLYYASRSNFPLIGLMEFKFMSDFKLADSLQFEIKFTSATKNMKTKEGTLDNHLSRFNFLELMIRMAEEKYKKQGPKMTKLYKAFQEFMNQDIMPNIGFILEAWDGWRKTQLWSLEVHDMFKANEDSIIKLMANYHQPRQKFLPQKECIEIFTRDTDIMLEKEALIAYGMSKMPLVKETTENSKYKRIMSNPEFYEMIGRVAEFKHKDQPNLSLSEKIGLVLDKILPIVNLKRKNPKGNEVVDESQSDEDY